MSSKISRNEPCPCGSGLKYKKCCINKKFDWMQTEDGQIYRSVPLQPEVIQIIKEQEDAFIRKHGKTPGPKDFIFSEFAKISDEEYEREVLSAMAEAGVDPACMYAFHKTKLIVTESNQNIIPQHDLNEWNAAVDEFIEFAEEFKSDTSYDSYLRE